MPSKFECPSCGEKHVYDGNVTIRVRGGLVRIFSSETEELVDLCPSCGSISSEVKPPLAQKGLGQFASRKGGVAGRDWAGSASK